MPGRWPVSHNESRPRRGGSRTPATKSAAMVADGGEDTPLTEDRLRRNGYLLAADEHARQMRTARIKLDRMLYGDPPTRFTPASDYSLPAPVLAAHIRQLRRDGWQSWEVRARFDFGTVTHAA